MKKLSLTIIAILIGVSVYAQGFSVGLNIGIPTGDAEDFHSFALGVDVNFLWEVSDTFDAGFATGYSNFFGEEVDFGSFGTVDVDDAGFLPLAAAGRLSLSDQFMFGADIGYAIGITPDGNDGGFYYRPMLGYDVSETALVTVSYSGIEVDEASFAAILVGISFALN